MTRDDELLATITVLRRADLEFWVREELVTATYEGDAWIFSDMQCARVRLLCTLRYEMEIESDSLPVVMSLLDELYETRRKLLSLTAAVSALDPEGRRRVLETIDSGTRPR